MIEGEGYLVAEAQATALAILALAGPLREIAERLESIDLELEVTRTTMRDHLADLGSRLDDVREAIP